MPKEQLRSLLAILLATFLIAGCASSGTPEPSPPSEPPEETPVVDPPPVEPTPPPVFGPEGPYVPGTMRLLERTFYFEFDRAVLNASDLAVLETHAGILRENRGSSVVIEGHCDERGTREYNLALGERRSDAIRSFLTSAGVSASQIETVSYGEERPEDPGHDESAWGRNRRGVMIYRQ
jgi:peptidoglycan-associated lipoprotein